MVALTRKLDSMQHYSRWYQSLLGEKILAELDIQLADLMSEIFGYYAVEIGALSGQHDFLQYSRITSSFSLGDKLTTASVISKTEQLPLTTDNIDLVIASHVLESSNDPHQILREIDRVLVPDGECILIGFNPFTPSRIISHLGGAIKNGFKKNESSRKNWSAHRLHDWFSLLGFKVLDVQYMGFRPNIKNKKIFDSLSWLDKVGEYAGVMLGSLYLFHVKKQVVTMHPHKKVWLAPAVLSGGKVILNNTAQKARQENYLNFEKTYSNNKRLYS